MAVENIELVDRDYNNCSKVAMPRQIKTRKISFSNIVERFRQFRISRLQRKMEKIVDKTLSTDYSKRKVERKLMSKSKKLAKLEEKIRVLNRENVPSKFVKHRAIKLRNYMMSNLANSSRGMYFVDLDDSDILGFISNDGKGSENLVNADAADVPADALQNSGEGTIDLASQSIDKDSLTNSINNEFNNLENNGEIEKSDIDKDSITGVIDNTLGDVNDNQTIDGIITPEIKENNETSDSITTALSDVNVNTDENNESIQGKADNSNDDNLNINIPDVSFVDSTGDEAGISTDKVDKESVDGVISGLFSDLENESTEEKNDDVTTFVSPEEVNMVVGNTTGEKEKASDDEKQEIEEDNSLFDINKNKNEEKVDSEKIKQYMDEAKAKISRSGSSAAKMDKYDENGGIRFKYSYTPMTDFEIAESRAKINNISNDFVPIDSSVSIEPVEEKRDVPIVVEDRSNDKALEDNIVDYTFDNDSSSIEVKDDDVDAAVIDVTDSRKAKLSEYNKLKNKILELREKSNAVSKDKMEAQTSAKQIELKVKQSKQKVAESDAALNEIVERMRLYVEDLQRDCEDTIRETHQIKDDIKNNTNIIEMQEDQFDENTRMINEFNRLIGSSEETHSIKK